MKSRVRILLGFFCCVALPTISSVLFAQPPDTLWTRYLGGEGDEYGDVILQTRDRNFAVSGSTNSFTEGVDFYFALLAGNGQLLWERAYGDSALYETCTDLIELDDGYLLAGYVLTFSPFRTDAKLVRINQAGDVTLQRTLSLADTFLSIFACGTREQGFWIAGKAQIEEVTRGFLFFLNESLEIIAQFYYPQNSRSDFSCGVRLTDGGYLLAGASFASDIAPSDVIVVRYSSTGTVLWNRTFGGSGDDLISSVDVVPSGGFILGGLTTSFEDENGSFYAIRLSESGDSLWSRTNGDPDGEDHGHQIIVAPDGGYLFCGHSHDHHGGAEQISIFKLDSLGNDQWQIITGSGDSETTEAIALTNDGGFAICAVALPQTESAKIFTARYGPLSAIANSERVPQQFALPFNYPNPFNGRTTLQFVLERAGVVNLSLYDMQGRLVRELAERNFARGEQRIMINADGLASGTYYCQISGAMQATVPMVLMR